MKSAMSFNIIPQEFWTNSKLELFETSALCVGYFRSLLLNGSLSSDHRFTPAFVSILVPAGRW